MKFEFLGHGLFDEYGTTVGNYLHKSFKDENFDTFQCFVAFTTLSGLSVFIDELEKVKTRYKKIEFYLGIDDKGTSREALLELLNKNIETYIYYNPTIRTRAIYHPKLYIFRGANANRVILGSSNLTRPGLFNNIEASLAMDFVTGNFQGAKLLKQIEEYFASFFGKNNQNLRKLDTELIKYLTDRELILPEKRIYKEEEEKEKTNVTDDYGNDLFTAVEASSVDLEELDAVDSETENSDYRPRYIALTEHYFAMWPEIFQKFKEFKSKYNTVIVPRDFENPTLYSWYVKQKALYREERIPEEHLEKLIDVDFSFEDGHKIRFDKIWESYYEELKQYYQENGHSDVPRRKDSNDALYKVSNFVAMQRHFKKKGDQRMTEYRIKKLEEINFSWEVGPRNAGLTVKNDDQWLENLAKYSDFKKEYKREPKQKKNTDEYKLGKWRNDQAVYRKQGVLSKDRIELLEAEGIIWDLDEHDFNQKIQKLLNYKEQFGNFDVPLSYVIDGVSLGQFVYSVKKRGTKPENKEKLEKIGMSGVILRTEAQIEGNKRSHITIEWRRNFDLLKKLKEEGVNINEIGQDNLDYPKIGNWIFNQQKRYRHSKLSDEQENLLMQLNLRLSREDTKDVRWKVFYELLSEYKKQYGNCRVPKSFDKELNVWVGLQRRGYKRKTLIQERVNKLNELEFEWTVDTTAKVKSINFES
jgi:HKD family nuclease